MNTTEAQAATIEALLLSRGYTISAAARAIRRSKSQVYYVVKGVRQSAIILKKLRALPKRRLTLRERIAH